MKNVLLLLTIGFLCVGCKRTTFDYASTPEPSNKPAYTVKFSSEIKNQQDKEQSVEISPNHTAPQS